MHRGIIAKIYGRFFQRILDKTSGAISREISGGKSELFFILGKNPQETFGGISEAIRGRFS